MKKHCKPIITMLYYKCCYFFNQGVKVVSKTNIFKRSIVLIIVLISALTLAGCGKKELKTPYGSLDDTTYISGDGYQVSEKELYDEMKISGLSVVERIFYEIIYQAELAKIDADFAEYKQDFIDIVNRAVFGTDKIKDLEEIEEKFLTQLVTRFVDAMYLTGLTISPSDIDSTDFTNHGEVLFNHYRLDIAKRIHAKEKLAEDILDKDSSVYISKHKDIVSYYKNNIEKRYPLSSINIRFTNSYEANQTLRQFSLKSYRSNWYKIADPRVEQVTGYALTVLEGLNLESKNGQLSDSDHQLYYDAYTINPDRRPTEDADYNLNIDEVVKEFLDIYNFIYPYRTQIDIANYDSLESILEDPQLVNDDEDNLGVFTKLYEDYPTTQSSLRTYIYDTLSTKPNETRFTASPRPYGNYYFITLKLKDHNEDLLENLDDDGELIVWADEDEETLTEIAEEYYNEIVDSRLTSSYINQMARERLDEAEIVIYDEELFLHLNQDPKDYILSKKSSKDIVAKVDETELTVDNLYSRLEEELGVSIAMDLALKKALLISEYREKITAEQMKQFKENFEVLIKQFGQDMFAQSGFPASIGRKKFLKLAFRSDTIDEAIEKVYVINELEIAYLKDLEKHFGEEIYEKFATIANRAQDQFFSITTSHLLIYVDMDEDDDPDKPSDFFENLDAAKKLEYENLILELMQLIRDKATRYSTFSNGLEAIVSEFNDSTKFIPSSCDAEQDREHKPECTWAKYKRAGLHLKFESLGTTTNQTNYPDSSAPFDDAFYERQIELYNVLKDNFYDIDEKFPKQLFDSRPTTYESMAESSFGWHLILATGGAVANSAKFTYDDDTKAKDSDDYKIYEQITIKDRNEEEIILDAYSDEKSISVNQARIYLTEIDSELGLKSIPSEIRTALNSYLEPVRLKYRSDQMQLHLLYMFLQETNFEYYNANNRSKLEQILTINQNQFLNYATDNDLFNEVYGDWFTIFKK